MNTDNDDLWGSTPPEDMFGGDEVQPGPDLFGESEPAPPAAAPASPDQPAAEMPADLPIATATAPVSTAKAQSDGYVVLARKYRPQTFDDLVGQDNVQQALRGAIATGQISHAYLFSGPRGTGKTSTARILAKALNCQDNGPRPDPCGKCSSCRSIMAGSSLDVIEIDAASNTGVDNIRDLKSGVVLAPFSRYKVYIVDEVHMLSNQAFNALLKTLEEPPPQVIFVLATTELHKVPETIISRCQTFMFRRFSLAELKGQLGHILDIETKARGIDVAPEDREAILELISRNAEGGMRDAQVTLDQVLVLAKGQLDFDSVRRFLGIADNEALDGFIVGLHEKDPKRLLELIDNLVAQGQDLELFVKSAADHMRDLLLVRTTGRDTPLINVSEDRINELENLANMVSPGFLVTAIEQFIKLVGEMKVSGQPRIVLELAVLKLVTAFGQADIEDILKRLEALEGKLANYSGGNGGGGGAAPGRPAPQTTSAAPAAPARTQSAPASRPQPAQPSTAAPSYGSATATATQAPPSASESAESLHPTGDADKMGQALINKLRSDYSMLHMSLEKVYCGQELAGRILNLFIATAPAFPRDQVLRQGDVINQAAQEIFGGDVVVKVVVREDMTSQTPAMETPDPGPVSRPARRPATDPPGPMARSSESESSRRPASSPDVVKSAKDPDGPVIYYPEEIREKAMRELKGDEIIALLSSDGKMKELVDKVKSVFGVDDKSLKFLRSTLV